MRKISLYAMILIAGLGLGTSGCNQPTTNEINNLRDSYYSCRDDKITNDRIGTTKFFYNQTLKLKPSKERDKLIKNYEDLLKQITPRE